MHFKNFLAINVMNRQPLASAGHVPDRVDSAARMHIGTTAVWALKARNRYPNPAPVFNQRSALSDLKPSRNQPNQSQTNSFKTQKIETQKYPINTSLPLAICKCKPNLNQTCD